MIGTSQRPCAKLQADRWSAGFVKFAPNYSASQLRLAHTRAPCQHELERVHLFLSQWWEHHFPHRRPGNACRLQLRSHDAEILNAVLPLQRPIEQRRQIRWLPVCGCCCCAALIRVSSRFLRSQSPCKRLVWKPQRPRCPGSRARVLRFAASVSLVSPSTVGGLAGWWETRRGLD